MEVTVRVATKSREYIKALNMTLSGLNVEQNRM